LILRHQLAVRQRRQPRCSNLNWADRALLAALLSVIPKARCQGLRLLVIPDTILRWHRDIVRRRWASRSKHRRTGRATTRRHIKALFLWLARENPEWGYRRIHGELAGLGVNVAASTVWEILKASGIGPAPRRTGPTWSQFLRSQAEAILACDLFSVDLLDGTQAYVLTVIGHAARRIRIFGVTLYPTGADAGIRTVLCNVRTARMNVIAERWIGGCRREFLDRTLSWNQSHRRQILRECENHHDQHRPHRFLQRAAPLKPLPEPVDLEQYRARRQARAGGLTRTSSSQ
jgi:transposase